MTAENFTQMVDSAYESAIAAAHPFTPSRAQLEAAMQPVIQKLLAMPRNEAMACISANFRGAGSYDAFALMLYKHAISVNGAAK